MTFEQWLQSPEGQLAMTYLQVDSPEVRMTAARLIFNAGELTGMRQSNEQVRLMLYGQEETP